MWKTEVVVVKRRRKVAEYFDEAIKDSKILIKQHIPRNTKHTHYTFAAKLVDNRKVKWKQLYNIYKSHNEGLYKILGRKIDIWENYYIQLKSAF